MASVDIVVPNCPLKLPSGACDAALGLAWFWLGSGNIFGLSVRCLAKSSALTLCVLRGLRAL